jgi:hypothetical protein
MEFDGGDIIAILLASGSALWTAAKELLGRSDRKRIDRLGEFDSDVRGPMEQVLAKLDTSITNFEVLRRGSQPFGKAKIEARNLVGASSRAASEASRVLNKLEAVSFSGVSWTALDSPFRDNHAQVCDNVYRVKNSAELDLALANLTECEAIFVQRVRERLRSARRAL